MQIEYEIVAVNAARSSIEVRFFSEALPEGMVYNIDLPAPLPRTEELHDYISRRAPRAEFERLGLGLDTAPLAALVGQRFALSAPAPTFERLIVEEL